MMCNNKSFKYIIKPGVLIIFAMWIFILGNNTTYAAFGVRAVVSAMNPDTEINLDWDLVNGAMYYKVFRNSGAEDVLIKTVDVNSDRYFTSFSDAVTDGANLVPETSYTYTVRAYSDQEMLNEIAAASATITTSQMLKPSNIASSYDINSNQITLKWKNNSKALAGSSVKRVGGAGTLSSVAGGVSTCTFNDPDMVKNQENQYTVVSTDSNGHTSQEGDAASIIPIDPPVITASVNNGTVLISWGGYGYIQNFELQRSRYTSSWDAWQTLSIQLTPGITSTNDVLPAAGVYRYRLAAKSISQYTGYSNISQSIVKPAAPKDLTGQFSSNTSVSLSWTNDVGNDSLLKIEKRVGSGSYAEIAMLPKDSASYTDTFSVDLNQDYYYRIIAFDSDNNKDVGSEYRITAALPSAPMSLSLYTLSDTRINLSWTDTSANETGFIIERKTGTGGFVQLGTTAANSTTYEDNAVSSSNTYTYRVWANNHLGKSVLASNEVSVAPNSVKAPNFLEAAVMSSTAVRLTWTYAASNSYTTVIERKAGASGSWVRLYDAAPNILSYSDSTVQPNTRYFYRIRAKTGQYVYSNAYPADDTGKEAYTVFSPLNLSLVNSSRIDLAWTDFVSGEVGFAVERKIDSGSFEQISVVEANKASYTDFTVTNGHVYTYRILLMNSATNLTIYTNEVSTTINTIIRPLSLDVDVISPSQINLSWSLSAPGSHKTVIERKTWDTGTWEEIGTVEGKLSYENTNLNSNTQYFYRVKVYYSSNVYSQAYPNDDAGIGKYTRIISPSNLIGTAISSTQINLSWYTNSSDAYFVIERRTKNGSYYEAGKTGVNATSWSDINLIPNLKYTYRIKAKTLYNESAYSEEVSLMCTNLAAPSGLMAQAAGQEGIYISWVDNTLNETGFEIWRLVDGMSEWELLVALEANSRIFSDTGLIEGKKYTYMVRAYLGSDGIYSPYSATASAIASIPAAPDNFTYSAVSSSSVKLTWRDNSNNESGFKVERKDNSTGNWTEIAALQQNVTSHTVSGLNSSTSYTYRIKAFNTTNNSFSYSTELTVSLRKPEVPSGIVLSSLSSAEIRIAWSDNSISETGFAIERKKNGGEFAEIVKVPANTVSYIDKGLSPNQQYFYRVRAYNGSGYSSYSDSKSVSTKKSAGYKDLSSVSWAKSAIESLSGRGIIKGKTSNQFYPNDKITRAEFVVILMRIFKPDEMVAGSFADVNGRHWFYKEVLTAKSLGIISGSSNNYFYPNRPITREDAAVMIARTLMAVDKPAAGSKTDVLKGFKDLSKVSSYALPSIASLYSEKIITGKEPDVLAPKANTTRAEAAVLLSRIVDR
ncbi:MAG TPA: S-layer homology domain-containing protein [Pseudobacteroides sp.]|uniref:S-layer homology domain-containing protein n=1 Tax=Pseudobacteroides sp. TaxID=1968840 RepID=UPI002F93D39D